MLLVALSTFHPPPSSSFASILPRLQIRPTQLASLLVQIFILLVIHSSHQLELWPSNAQDHPIRTSPSSETGSTPMSSLRSGLAGWGAALLFRDERTIIRRSGWLGGHSWPTATGALSSSWDSFSDFTNSLSLLLASSKSRAMVPLNEWPRRSWCSHDIYHNLRAFSNGSGRNYKRQSWLNPRPQESWSPFSCDLDLFLPPLALSWSLGCSPPHTRHSTQFPPEQPQAYSTLHSSTIF